MPGISVASSTAAPLIITVENHRSTFGIRPSTTLRSSSAATTISSGFAPVLAERIWKMPPTLFWSLEKAFSSASSPLTGVFSPPCSCPRVYRFFSFPSMISARLIFRFMMAASPGVPVTESGRATR